MTFEIGEEYKIKRLDRKTHVRNSTGVHKYEIVQENTRMK